MIATLAGTGYPGPVMIEVLLRGPGKNALSSTLMLALQADLAAADGAPVLLRGEGDAFSAGLDLREILTLDRPGMQRYLEILEQTMLALYRYPGPLVAFINGHAIAGGCIFALCADLRVCATTPTLKLGLTEVALGLRFPTNVLRLVRHRVAANALDEVVLGAQLHDPAGGLRLGLVDELGDLAVATARLQTLATHPRDVYAATKSDLRAGVLIENAADRHADLAAALPFWTSPMLLQRVQEFLARRRK